MAEQEPYTMPAAIPQLTRPSLSKGNMTSYAAAAASASSTAPPRARGPSGSEIKTIAREVLRQQAVHQLPIVDVAALEVDLSAHVDAQIAKIQATISTQLEGPLMHDVARLVEIELLSCDPYISALQKHFEEFDNSKLSLVEASWKPKNDLHLDEHDRLMKEADAIAYENRSPCTYTKGHIKEQCKNIDYLKSEVDTQERKVEKLENTLEAALKRIENLEQELKRPSVVEFN
jgi:hypothetical protein